MAKILVHVTVGPDDPTKAALAFLVAKSVLEEGHQLFLFVAGDGVQLLTEKSAATVEGLGTGKLADHFEAISAASADVYFSGMSAKAGMPNRLVQLIAECDRVISY